MSVNTPHYLLYSDTGADPQGQPRWRFVLQAADGTQRLEASDSEPQLRGARLDLLSVIRGLEALNQPSRVTLVTSSRYVGRGLRYGIDQWRRSGWHWERFGVMSPVKHADLWRRLDQALHYHDLECRVRKAEHVADDLTRRFRVAPQSAASRVAGESRPDRQPAALPRRRSPDNAARRWSWGGLWGRMLATGGGLAAAVSGLLWLRTS